MSASDYAAWYAAIVATLAFLFHIYRHLYRHRQSTRFLRIEVYPDLEGIVRPQTFFVRIVNIGTKRTKLRNVGFGQYPLKEGGEYAAVLILDQTHNNLPTFLEPGDEWTVSVDWSNFKSIVSIRGLYVFIFHSLDEHQTQSHIANNTNEILGFNEASGTEEIHFLPEKSRSQTFFENLVELFKVRRS